MLTITEQKKLEALKLALVKCVEADSEQEKRAFMHSAAVEMGLEAGGYEAEADQADDDLFDAFNEAGALLMDFLGFDADQAKARAYVADNLNAVIGLMDIIK